MVSATQTAERSGRSAGRTPIVDTTQIALSANGTNILWSSGNAGVLLSQGGSAFARVASLPAGAAVAADRRNDSVFYAATGSKFLVSSDGGKTFAATPAALGASYREIAARWNSQARCRPGTRPDPQRMWLQ